jgi:hypothetical protein
MNLSSKLKLDNIILVLFLLLLLSREEIFIIPIVGQRLYMFLIFLISLYVLFTKNLNTIFFKKGTFILFCNLYLFFILLMEYGDPDDLAALFTSYIVATSFFIIGLYWGFYNKTELLKKFFKILFILTFLNLVPFVVSSITTGVINKYALALFYGLGNNTMIMFWPLIFIIGFVGYFFNKERFNKKWEKYFYFSLFIVFVLTMIVSAFTAVVLMLAISIAILSFLIFKDKISFTRFFGFGLTILLAYILLSFIADGKFGELGGTATKIKAIFGVFESNSDADFDEQLDTASASRYSLLEISYENINKSPYIGNGYYFASIGKDINKQVSSGHSSFFDFLAYFGLFAIPFFLIFIRFMIVTYRLGNNSSGEIRQMGYTIFAVLISYSFISFSNPYLQYSTFDLLFLLGGWATSQFEILKKQKRVNINFR